MKKKKGRGKGQSLVSKYLRLEKRHPYPNLDQKAEMDALWAQMSEGQREAVMLKYMASNPRCCDPFVR